MIAEDRRRDTHNRDVTLAWQTAALHRQEKLQKLDTLLAKRPQPRQTAPQLRTALHVLSAQYGLPLRYVKRTKGQTKTHRHG